MDEVTTLEPSAMELANSTASQAPRELEAAPLALAFLVPATPPGIYSLQVLLFGVLSVTGVVTNTVSICVLVTGQLLTNWTHGMILQLSVTDLLLCLNWCSLYLPTAVHGWYDWPVPVCSIRLTLLFTSFSVTIYSFALTAIHRYLTIVHNKGNLGILQKRWQPLLFASIWVVTIATVVPVMATGDVIVIFFRDLCFYSNPKTEIFRNFLFGFSMFLTVVLIPYFYIHIYLVVRRSARSLQATGSSASASQRAARRSAVVLFVLYATYSVAYMPYTLVTYVRGYMHDLQTKRLTFIISWLLIVIVVAVNPILYGLLFRSIREQYSRILFRFSKRRNAVSTTQDTVTAQVSQARSNRDGD